MGLVEPRATTAVNRIDIAGVEVSARRYRSRKPGLLMIDTALSLRTVEILHQDTNAYQIWQEMLASSDQSTTTFAIRNQHTAPSGRAAPQTDVVIHRTRSALRHSTLRTPRQLITRCARYRYTPTDVHNTGAAQTTLANSRRTLATKDDTMVSRIVLPTGSGVPFQTGPAKLNGSDADHGRQNNTNGRPDGIGVIERVTREQKRARDRAPRFAGRTHRFYLRDDDDVSLAGRRCTVCRCGGRSGGGRRRCR